MIHFNPRSREGSDPKHSKYFLSALYFNPRSREGSDVVSTDWHEDLSISIHAPVKGATGNDEDFILKNLFQSTLP